MPTKKKPKTSTWYRKRCVKWAKEIALKRDQYRCVRCGKSKQQGYQIHASHVYPEGKYRNMSALPLNLKALCYLCHLQWWHKNPLEAADWFKSKFPDRAKELKEISQRMDKINWKKEYESLGS